MIIKVANPGECPLRVKKANICSLESLVCCFSPMIFPDSCPLHSRTIVIEKAEAEDEQETADDKRKAMCERHGVTTGL